MRTIINIESFETLAAWSRKEVYVSGAINAWLVTIGLADGSSRGMRKAGGAAEGDASKETRKAVAFLETDLTALNRTSRVYQVRRGGGTLRDHVLLED